MQYKKKVFVTGANGFVGSAVIEAMFLSNQYIPIAGVSSLSRAAKVGRFPIDIRVANLLDIQGLKESLNDIDTIVHCAAGSEKSIIQGTENLLSTSKDLRIKKVVHISTVDVYGNVSGAVDESCPLQSKGTDYSNWKIEAERICQRFIVEGFPITILRPAIIYGPYSTLWSLRFAERLKTGHLTNLGERGEGACNLIYINDLVDAIFKVIPNNVSDNNAYNIVGDDIITWNKYFEKIANEMGIDQLQTQNSLLITTKNMVLNPIRFLVKLLLTKFKDLIMKIYTKYPLANKFIKVFEKLLKGNPDGNEMGLYGNNIFFVNKKAKIDFAYLPLTDSESGVKESAIWLKSLNL